jgi:hypothetical protein
MKALMATDPRPIREDALSGARGEQARARADELQQRRADLAKGQPSTEETVKRARLRAEEALARATAAHHASAKRHVDAGVAHRRAAAVHEQAAMLAADGSGDSHQSAAEHHRDEADRHEHAAVDEVEAGEADARRRS